MAFFIPLKTGYAKQNTSEIQVVQAAEALKKRIAGASVQTIATEMGVSTMTIDRRLALAKRLGLVELAKERVVNELVPKAIEALSAALDLGDVDAAKAVLFGAGILEKQPTRTTVRTEMTLDNWREQRSASIETTTAGPAAAASVLDLWRQAEGHTARAPVVRPSFDADHLAGKEEPAEAPEAPVDGEVVLDDKAGQ